jgi:hypothetical protein
MFAVPKKIFAGKQNLQQRPFCPYLSNDSGYRSLRLEQKQRFQDEQQLNSIRFPRRNY